MKSSVNTCRQPGRLPTGIAVPEDGITTVTIAVGLPPTAFVARTDRWYVLLGTREVKVADRAEAPTGPLHGPKPLSSIPSRATV